MSNLRPVAVITGASAGIGLALARVFARDGHELALVARREDRLRALADEIAATGAPRPIVLAADLLKPGIARVIGDALTAQGVEPQFLVNNAGFGLVGAASALNHDEQSQMIDLNVRALTELSLAFVDSLARHRGGLLNVGSMAGFLPNGRLFAPMRTPFADRAGLSKKAIGPSFLIQSAEQVAEAGYRGLIEGRRTVVPGAINKLITFLIRVTPRGLILSFVDYRQKRRRSARPT